MSHDTGLMTAEQRKQDLADGREYGAEWARTAPRRQLRRLEKFRWEWLDRRLPDPGVWLLYFAGDVLGDRELAGEFWEDVIGEINIDRAYAATPAGGASPFLYGFVTGAMDVWAERKKEGKAKTS
jgi:hypothetical protein